MTRIYDNHTLQTIASHWLSVARTVLDSPYYLQNVRESAYLMCPFACPPRAKSALFLIATMPFFYPGGNTTWPLKSEGKTEEEKVGGVYWLIVTSVRVQCTAFSSLT